MGYPPFKLMFGWVPHLSVDVLFCTVLHDSSVTSYEKCVACLPDDLKEATMISQDHAEKEQYRHVQLYNRKVKGSNISISNRVLLASRKEGGTNKLAASWDLCPSGILLPPLVTSFQPEPSRCSLCHLLHTVHLQILYPLLQQASTSSWYFALFLSCISSILSSQGTVSSQGTPRGRTVWWPQRPRCCLVSARSG